MKLSPISAVSLVGLAAGLVAATTAANATVAFSTFVTSADIGAAEGGNTSVIAFNYTGTGFVGSVYPTNNQLYSTNLTGGNVMTLAARFPASPAKL